LVHEFTQLGYGLSRIDAPSEDQHLSRRESARVEIHCVELSVGSEYRAEQLNKSLLLAGATSYANDAIDYCERGNCSRESSNAN
jgi:hypothetical protein